MIAEFVYSQPVKIWFGEGQFARLGEILGELGCRSCVIACGKHFAPEAEKLITADLRIKAVFGAVEQNPQLSGIEQTVRLCRELEADTVIGIGGGSSLDTAKFAAAIALGDGAGEDYYRGRLPFPANRLKIVCVPTTAGTGSEVTQVSVMSHGAEKRTINHPAFLPTAAIVDPALTVSMPPRTTVAELGARSMSVSSARLVSPFARASRNLPTVMSVTIMPADSKYRFVLYSVTSAQSPCPIPYPMRKMANAPNSAAAIEPMPTRLSMFGAPRKRFLKPEI